MQHESDKYGENGSKILELLCKKICPKICIRIELEPGKHMAGRYQLLLKL